MIEKLSKAGVPTGIHYPVPIHKHECFAELDFARGKVSQTLKCKLQNFFHYPYPQLTENEIIKICSHLTQSQWEVLNV